MLKSRYLNEEELRNFGFKSIGKNVRISSDVRIYGEESISIGNNTRIDDFCILVGGKKGIAIGSNIHIAHQCIIVGNAGVVMNDFSGLSSRVSIYSATDDYSGESLTNPTVPLKYKKVKEMPVELGRHVIIGTNSTILPGVIIGEGSSVGANSLVTKSLSPWGVYGGIPAKFIKERSKNLLELEKEYLKEYEMSQENWKWE